MKFLKRTTFLFTNKLFSFGSFSTDTTTDCRAISRAHGRVVFNLNRTKRRRASWYDVFIFFTVRELTWAVRRSDAVRVLPSRRVCRERFSRRRFFPNRLTRLENILALGGWENVTRVACTRVRNRARVMSYGFKLKLSARKCYSYLNEIWLGIAKCRVDDDARTQSKKVMFAILTRRFFPRRRHNIIVLYFFHRRRSRRFTMVAYNACVLFKKENIFFNIFPLISVVDIPPSARRFIFVRL